MKYEGFNIKEGSGFIEIEGVRDLDLKHTFECGQCFRWIRQQDGSYTGVAFGKAVNMSLSGGVLTIVNASSEDFIKVWYDYLDLGRDYGAVKKMLSGDETMKKAIEFGYGIRILRQDFWETLVSFIISANNRIPMIMKVVQTLSEMYGDVLETSLGRFYTFPFPGRIQCRCLEEIMPCKGGFRCSYVLDAAQKVTDGSFDMSKPAGLATSEARKYLTTLKGVGDKVADCVLLYSGTKHDVFPTDVWVKRVMEELYFKREASFLEIQGFAAQTFGNLSGIAQQYLFYYARENRIGRKE